MTSSLHSDFNSVKSGGRGSKEGVNKRRNGMSSRITNDSNYLIPECKSFFLNTIKIKDPNRKLFSC